MAETHEENPSYEEIAEEIKRAASESISEEDLRQEVEYIIRSRVIEKLKEKVSFASWKPPRARYEVTLVSGGRIDALYGHLMIEYERPGTIGPGSGFEKAVEQVKGYIRDHAGAEANYPKYFGVVLDGYRIGFVRYRTAIKGFESKGPFDVNGKTVAKLIRALIGLRRKALSTEELLKDFGPDSPVAKECIKTFYNKLSAPSPRTQMLFEDWRRVFSQVCAYSPEKIKGLEEVYGFGGADPEKLLFALHTYYALIMKLLAAEVASLYVAPRLLSYLRTLEDAYYKGHERLREELKELEEGGIFSELGIANFLEADYFAWYLDEWDEEIAKRVMGIVDRLLDYDPSAAELEPERIRDLFKRLYQNLVPKKIRHDLGEYYTPDWLAELVLNEVGWTLEVFEKKAEEQNNTLAPLDLRLLDPACGSGTFLVLAISRLRQYVEENWVDKGTALRKITKNVVGFDLNPLAVIASRTNYLIALGDMLRERGSEPIEIPVYLADSILAGRRQTLTGFAYVLRTAAGEFEIPVSIVEKGLLAGVLSLLEECVKGKYSSSEFKARLLKEVSLEENETLVLVQLFEKLSKLEREGRNRIWARVLRNSFAPLFAGKFDYVVGNPPWINWENLPKDYREETRQVWERYNLIAKRRGRPSIGKAKRDMAMLFTYVCIDRYLAIGGKFGFLITQTVFKSMAGEGFRAFWIPPEGPPFKVVKVHDLVKLLPFEGAQNRTAAVFCVKGEETSYPLPYVVWKGPTVDQGLSLEEVQKIASRTELEARPLRRRTGPWSTLSAKAHKALECVIGASAYRAFAGLCTALNAVYWIRIMGKVDDQLLIENEVEGAKVKVKKMQSMVEADLLYPLLRGRDAERWKAVPSLHVIVPTTTQGVNMHESELKVKYPKTYGYLLHFKDALERRSIYKLVGKSGPWYGLYVAIGPYIFAPYKVVWREVSPVFNAAVLDPVNDQFVGQKVVIPDHTIVLVPCQRADEAHFICAILNSSVARLIINSYLHLHPSPHVMDHVKIPKYDPENNLHRKLSNLSTQAHRLKREGKEQELAKIEEEIDETVAQLYGLTDDELKEIKRCLAFLEDKEIEEQGRENDKIIG